MMWLIGVLTIAGFWVSAALGQDCTLVWSDAMRNKVIKSRHTVLTGDFTEQTCMDACTAYTEFQCLSIEYRKGKKRCQLSKFRRDQVPAKEFKRARRFVYRERLEGSCSVVLMCLQSSNPCEHGGQPYMGVSGNYRCFECDAGWAGIRCEVAVDDACSSDPCLHGGRCYLDGSVGYRCFECEAGWGGIRCQTAEAVDCNSYYNRGERTDGLYTITPTGSAPFEVYCELSGDTAWTYVQHRSDGSVDFDRDWLDYKVGFGSALGEHWLGNNNIYLLTSQAVYTLRVEGTTLNGDSVWAEYDRFGVSDEASKYTLELGVLTGADPVTTARSGTDGFLEWHRDAAFTTKDRKNDAHGSVNCAQYFNGGWWYSNCGDTYLNSPRGTTSCSPMTCIKWCDLPLTYVEQTTMKITRT